VISALGLVWHGRRTEQWPGNVIPNRGCSEYRDGDYSPSGSEGNVEAHRNETRAYEILMSSLIQ
jgi:hypothetical protein